MRGAEAGSRHRAKRGNASNSNRFMPPLSENHGHPPLDVVDCGKNPVLGPHKNPSRFDTPPRNIPFSNQLSATHDDRHTPPCWHRVCSIRNATSAANAQKDPK